MFRKPIKKELFFLLIVIILYISGFLYAYKYGLSIKALFKYGLLQPKGITGSAARITDIETPLSWNVSKILWFIYIKGAAFLVELFQYWVTGMFIAAALIILIPWEKVKKKIGHGGLGPNFMAAAAGAVIPICSCGIVPVLAGMIEAGIPLGSTMAFLIAAPMLNVPAVFMTAGILGWKLAVGRIFGTFLIALTVGGVLSHWQKKERFLRKFIKIAVTPSLSPELQQFAFRVGMASAGIPESFLQKNLLQERKTNFTFLQRLVYLIEIVMGSGISQT